jgi:hypothetical protein
VLGGSRRLTAEALDDRVGDDTCVHVVFTALDALSKLFNSHLSALVHIRLHFGHDQHRHSAWGSISGLDPRRCYLPNLHDFRTSVH